MSPRRQNMIIESHLSRASVDDVMDGWVGRDKCVGVRVADHTVPFHQDKFTALRTTRSVTQYVLH